MRTTIDLPADLHRLATQISRDKRQTLSQVVVDMMRASIAPAHSVELRISPRTGFPVLHGFGRPITTEDVRSVDDDDE